MHRHFTFSFHLLVCGTLVALPSGGPLRLMSSCWRHSLGLQSFFFLTRHCHHWTSTSIVNTPQLSPSKQGAPPPQRVAVIGGGITGLAAAHRLIELDSNLRVTLFEASDHLGGVLRTTSRDGFLLEAGADNFITTVPWALDLCRRIGFEDQLIPTNSGFRQVFVVCRGKPHHLPDGFVVMAPGKLWPILTTPILSPLGKLRLACERFVPSRRGTDDESLASFCKRRLGRETYERLVQPLVGGIYTGDPEKLSLRSTLPRFAEMEEQHGSLTRALGRQPKTRGQTSGARYSMFVAPRDGMSSLIDAIAIRLPPDSVCRGARVQRIERTVNGWKISVEETSRVPIEFDAVILATPAKTSANLMQALDKQIAAELSEIHHARCSIVSLGYSREQITHPLDGFGVVVPHIERRKILSASFSSIKYPGRAPDGHVLIRTFIGGDCQPELANLSDDDLLRTATDELRTLLNISGDPVMSHISCRRAAMPQYFVGHADRIASLRRNLVQHPGLLLAGNAYDGVGVPTCIRSGELAAECLVG